MGTNKKTEAQLQNTVQAQKSVLDAIDKLAKTKGNPHAADHKKVGELIGKLFNGEKLNSSEQKLTAQYIRVAEPTENNPNATKFYIAKEPGNFKSQGPTSRVRINVGAKDSSNPVNGAFGKFVRNNGMAELSPSTFGGKLSTANQTYVDKAGKHYKLMMILSELLPQYASRLAREYRMKYPDARPISPKKLAEVVSLLFKAIAVIPNGKMKTFIMDPLATEAGADMATFNAVVNKLRV